MAVRPELPTFACLEPLEARLLLATTVFYDGFEDAFPGTPPNNWVVGNDPGTTTKAKWGDNYALAAAGDWSAFCADNGDANNGDARETYDNKLHTTMERQNVSLAGFTTAALTFQYWLNSEENTVNPADPYDYFTVNVKDQSGVWHNKVFFDSGDDSALGWQTKTVDLSAYAGQNNLTIQFRFDSDTSYVPPAPSGVWVDEISLIGNPLPDLSGYDCYAPASAFWGQTISLQGQVDNTGSVGTGAFTQQFYLSADTTWGNADDVLLGSYPHAALAASELGPDFNLSVTLPGAPPNAAFQPSGTYYIGMKTDALGAVAESDETNNSPGGPLWQWYDWDDIAIGYDTHVDLTVYKITDTSGTPGSANPGQDKSTFNSGETVRITLKAANAGALRNVQLGLVLYGPDNTTVVYDSHDPLKTPSGHVEDLVPAAPLAGASTGYYSFDWTLPSAAAPGAYDIVGAIRDSANWNFVLDNTAPGAGTVGSGPEAVVRDRIWRYEAAPANRTADDTSEYMMGKVQVNVVLPASTGVNSTEAWTIQEITDIKRELAEGVAWWTTTLPDAHLSFQFDFTYADHPISTTLEPITLTSDNDDLWMADMLTVLAPGTTGAVDDRLRTYADQTRRASGSDWAYTVFVVDDTQDADHMFADEWFAYADLGGPVAVMTYHNDGWGVDNMGMVFAHETGHIFYALDEYADSGSLYTDYSGYLNIQNTNAIDGNPHPATVVPSLMGESDRQATAYDGHTSSLTSLQMVGYRDTDADGILDILDTAPSISTTVLAANSVTGAIRVQTTGAIVPLSNNNPLGWGHDISLNTVSAIQYHLDGGPWLDVPAQDGAYDEPQETAILDLAGLANGAHHL
ncbi:MAG: hypothetical protein NT049_09045, partial [Planctomycetota bacterium]|nr:hypothetical protein [Planctomycetota bacterium]